MSGEIRPEALIHDLAIVLRAACHPQALIGPSGILAVRRMQDVLGWTDGELTAGIEDRLRRVLLETEASDAVPGV
jgi:hypothetical protein